MYQRWEWPPSRLWAADLVDEYVWMRSCDAVDLRRLLSAAAAADVCAWSARREEQSASFSAVSNGPVTCVFQEFYIIWLFPDSILNSLWHSSSSQTSFLTSSIKSVATRKSDDAMYCTSYFFMLSLRLSFAPSEGVASMTTCSSICSSQPWTKEVTRR